MCISVKNQRTSRPRDLRCPLSYAIVEKAKHHITQVGSFMKKLSALILTVLVLAAALCGCGGSSDAPDTTGTTPAPAADKTDGKKSITLKSSVPGRFL